MDPLLSNRFKIEPLNINNGAQLNFINVLNKNSIWVQPPDISISNIPVMHTEYPRKIVDSIQFSDVIFRLNCYDFNISNIFEDIKNDLFNVSIVLLDLNLESWLRLNCYRCKIKTFSIESLDQTNITEILNVQLVLSTTYLEIDI